MGSAAALTGDSAGPGLQMSVAQRFASGFSVAARLDVRLPPGTILVFFGPSGSGKTTLLRLIAGLERPDRGTIRFDDQSWCDTDRGIWRPAQDRRVGLVFQEPALFPHLSVRANIAYGVAARRHPGRSRIASPPGRAQVASGSDRIAEIAGTLGIADLDRYPRKLSGGEAQRVALARALTPDPRLLLLDEPFASLDGPTRGRLRRDLRAQLRRIGTPAILVTHDRTEALAIGDSMAVVMAGEVRQVGAVADVFSHPRDAGVAAALGVEAVLPARIAETSDGLLAVAINDVVLHVAERTDDDRIQAGSHVYACIRAEDVTLEAQTSTRASARNHLAARVMSIQSEGAVDRITLDCGFPLDAVITRRSREDLNLSEGVQVVAAIKATSIHLVPRA
jgi:molybdate transport system ATP-binding protein